MPATGYIVEYDKSGRATCKGSCKQKIEKGVLRFGSCSTASWDGEQTHYRNMACITAKVAQNALTFYRDDITQLRGWDGLTAADQDQVRKIFNDLINTAPAEKPKRSASKKKKADDADDDDAAPAPKKKKADDDDAPKKKKAPPKKKAEKKAVALIVD